MRPNFRVLNNRAKSLLKGTTLLAGIGAVFVATAPAYAADADSTIETVVVTGYRASLTASTDAKRAATNFTDSVFAEDIGKFPDSNIAESLNRIPGVTISREIDGEGVNVTIRGLGTNFTKVLLNNAQVAVASTGSTDSQNANREVDLNMFPTELFSQLTVSKTPTADLVEGGAAGTVNMRSARPFDKPGPRVTFTGQGVDNTAADSLGERGAIIVSDTWGSFGALVGVAGVHNNVMTTGFETIGWTNPALSTTAVPPNGIQCTGTCNATGGGNWTIPGTVPNNVGNGLVPGTTIDQAFLLAHNPGVTIAQIDGGIIPRLGRDMYERGTRDRYNGVVSLEWRPTDSLHFYLDAIGGRTFNNLDRSDLDWVGRSGSMIPLNETVDAQDVVTAGTFANSQFFLEARPYKEKGDFVSINPGMEWEITDDLHLSLQANASRSHFFRDSPTILVETPPSAGNAANVPGVVPPVGGVTVTYVNDGSIPSIKTNIDLNNPANFQWAGGRVNLQDEKRYTFTDGIHGDLAWGGDTMMLKVGGAFDDVYRNITALDNSQAWQNAICGDNPNVFVPSPNTQPPCQGLVSATPNGVGNPGGYPTYPGLGTNYSAGFPALVYQGSLVPQSSLASFLLPGPTGFITANYAAIEKASNYATFDANAPFSASSNTAAQSGTIDEKTFGMYAELNGVQDFGGHNLRYNVGLRWIQTLQTVIGPVSFPDPRNAPPPPGVAPLDGGKYPNTVTFATTRHDYNAFLPSINVVYDVSDDFQVRGSLSRTMTRVNPSSLLPGVGFSDPSAFQATLGNPNLAPFFSNNIDLGAEYYTGGEGYFGFTAFRKGVSGFTTGANSIVPFSALAPFGITFASLNATQQAAINLRGGPAAALIQETMQVNASGLLTVNGLEFDWVQPLDFLLEPHGLKGFGFTANLTIVDQKGSGAAPAVVTGVAPYTYNVTAYYENEGAMLRLSYVFNATSINAAPSSNQNGITGAGLFTSPYGQFDLSSSYRLSNLFGALPGDPEVTFDGQNLTKSKLRTYFQFPQAAFTYYNQGSVYMFGLRGTF